MNILFQFLQIGSGKLFQSIVFFKQIFRNHVHPRIGTLCTQYDRDQQLPSIFMVQITTVFRTIFLIQQL